MKHEIIAFVSLMLVVGSISYDIHFAEPNENRIIDDFVTTVGVVSLMIFAGNLFAALLVK